MQYILLGFLTFLTVFSTTSSAATQRTMQFSNDKVSAWETVVYPGAKQVLKPHRHEHDRVVVAFNDGLLKVTNDKGKTHYLTLKKNKAYFLAKDVPNELHTDENVGSEKVKVLVIELKQ